MSTLLQPQVELHEAGMEEGPENTTATQGPVFNIDDWRNGPAFIENALKQIGSKPADIRTRLVGEIERLESQWVALDDNRTKEMKVMQDRVKVMDDQINVILSQIDDRKLKITKINEYLNMCSLVGLQGKEIEDLIKAAPEDLSKRPPISPELGFTADDCLNVFKAHPDRELSHQEIVDRAPSGKKNDAKRSIHQRTNYLYQQGKLDRITNGVYRLKREGFQPRVTVVKPATPIAPPSSNTTFRDAVDSLTPGFDFGIFDHVREVTPAQGTEVALGEKGEILGLAHVPMPKALPAVEEAPKAEPKPVEAPLRSKNVLPIETPVKARIGRPPGKKDSAPRVMSKEAAKPAAKAQAKPEAQAETKPATKSEIKAAIKASAPPLVPESRNISGLPQHLRFKAAARFKKS